jgi:hypothetical protein
MPIAFSVAGFLLAITAGMSFCLSAGSERKFTRRDSFGVVARFCELLRWNLGDDSTIAFASGAVSVGGATHARLNGSPAGQPIAISILLLPRLGAAKLIALIVAGQMMGSLA